MVRNALYVAALIVGVSYFFSDAVVAESGPLHLAWKGGGVGLLALWAAIRARSVDGWLLAGVMAVHACADVVIETHGTVVGGALFLAGHLVAIVIYARHVGQGVPWPVVPAAMAAVALIAWPLPADRALAGQIAIYGAVLGAMLGMAIRSRFARDRVALGAALFVFSDLLIFARLGPLADSVIPDLLVWPTYFAAQALIALGVVQGLEARKQT